MVDELAKLARSPSQRFSSLTTSPEVPFGWIPVKGKTCFWRSGGKSRKKVGPEEDRHLAPFTRRTSCGIVPTVLRTLGPLQCAVISKMPLSLSLVLVRKDQKSGEDRRWNFLNTKSR